MLAEDGIPVAQGFALSGSQLRATVQHIALNDPEYVLADIAAKRALVRSYEELVARREAVRQADLLTDSPMPRLEAYEQVLRQLATPFAGHADYDPSWAPS